MQCNIRDVLSLFIFPSCWEKVKKEQLGYYMLIGLCECE